MQLVFEKYSEVSDFLLVRPVGAKLFHADGRTDGHDEANIRLSQLCERTQKLALEFRVTLLVLVSFLANAGLWGKYGYPKTRVVALGGSLDFCIFMAGRCMESR